MFEALPRNKPRLWWDAMTRSPPLLWRSEWWVLAILKGINGHLFSFFPLLSQVLMCATSRFENVVKREREIPLILTFRFGDLTFFFKENNYAIQAFNFMKLTTFVYHPMHILSVLKGLNQKCLFDIILTQMMYSLMLFIKENTLILNMLFILHLFYFYWSIMLMINFDNLLTVCI